MNNDTKINFVDGLQNVLTGLGTQKDKKTYDTFVDNTLSDNELEVSYDNNWISSQAVDVIPDDMTRAWRTFSADKLSEEQIEILDEAEMKFQIKRKFNESLKWSRLYGGAGLVLGLDEGRHGEPDTPLVLEQVKKDSLQFVHVVDKTDLVIESLNNTNYMKENFGQPEFYRLSNVNTRIHHSRVIPFYGQMLPKKLRERHNYWGSSSLKKMWSEILNSSRVTESVATLLSEANVDIISIEGLWKAIKSKEDSDILKRFMLAATGKSVCRMMLLDSTETYERKDVKNLGQLGSLINTFLEIASAATDIPVTRFLGRTPSGLTATGEFDLKNYYGMIGSLQESTLLPAINYFDQIFVRSVLGTMPDGWKTEFNPLWQESGKEKAEIENIEATMDNTYIMNGTLTNAIVAKELKERGTYKFIDDEHIKELEEIENEIKGQEFGTEGV